MNVLSLGSFTVTLPLFFLGCSAWWNSCLVNRSGTTDVLGNCRIGWGTIQTVDYVPIVRRPSTNWWPTYLKGRFWFLFLRCSKCVCIICKGTTGNSSACCPFVKQRRQKQVLYCDQFTGASCCGIMGASVVGVFLFLFCRPERLLPFFLAFRWRWRTGLALSCSYYCCDSCWRTRRFGRP